MSRPRALIDLRTGTRLLLSTSICTPASSAPPAPEQRESKEEISKEQQQEEVDRLLRRLTTHLETGKLALSDIPSSLLSGSLTLPFTSRALQEFHAALRSLQAERREWEVQHPIAAAQETEARLYSEFFVRWILDPATVRPDVGHPGSQNRDWEEIERQTRSLERYVVENKMLAERVRSAGLDETLRKVLARFRDWDRDGLFIIPLGHEKEREHQKEKEIAERVWGLVDKIGSGLSYLLKLDGQYQSTNEAATPRPTTRSVFLLKSAPPAPFSFAASEDEWLERKLVTTRTHLEDLVLDAANPIKRGDEARWNIVYRDLEGLEDFFQRDGKGISTKNIRTSKIDETIRLICERLEILHQDSRAGEDEAEFALMHISWELATRISKSFTASEYFIDSASSAGQLPGVRLGTGAVPHISL